MAASYLSIFVATIIFVEISHHLDSRSAAQTFNRAQV